MARYTISQSNPSIPLPPQASAGFMTFPSDLMRAGNNFFTQIQLVEYNVKYSGVPGQPGVPILGGWAGGTGQGAVAPFGGYCLPLPDTINDVQTIRWEPVGVTETAVTLSAGVMTDLFGSQTAGDVITAVGKIAGGASAITGAKLNPAMFMLFKYQNFKEFSFGWKLTVRNKEEAKTLQQLILSLKTGALPSFAPGTAGVVVKYPHVVLMQMVPLNNYGLVFKPLAIEAVAINWAGGGQPAFIDDKSLDTPFPPVVVDLSLQMKELQLWYNSDGNLV